MGSIMKQKEDLVTIKDNESYLRQVSSSVDLNKDENIKNDILVLEEFCEENDVMAMAAIQLGIPKRIVYLKNTNLEIVKKMQTNSQTKDEDSYNESRVLINPIILNREGLTEYWEACASCLDSCGRVLRPYKMDIEYYDINSDKHIETFEGFECTVLSHEIDHLDGILHMDIAEEVLIMEREERKKWRQTHDYKIYDKIGSYEELKNKEKVKNEKSSR